MSCSHFAKAVALFVLAFGLVLLAGFGDLAAAGKADEAKKAHEALKNAKDAKDRTAAAEQLGKLGEVNYKHAEAAIPDLTAALDDKDAGVRAASAVALGKIGPDDKKALVEKLTAMLKDDEDDAVKLAATQGLGYLGSDAKSALGELRATKKGLSDMKGKFARAIDAAIRTIQPPAKQK